jgi:pilus assembly protein CpaB
VLRTIEANEPILSSKVSGEGEKATLSAIISEEMRAMTIRVNDVIGVAGFIVPGDRVDVLLTREEGGDKNQITDILLQNVKVLGIDQLANDNQEKPIVVQAVTVEVSPEQSQKLTLASQVGNLTLALRNVLDAEAELARTVGIRDLKIGEVNDAVADAQPGKPAKVAKVRGKGTAVDPLASVKIFRALNGSEYKVEKEGSGAGAPAAKVLDGAAEKTAPAAPKPAAPGAPTPLMPQPEVSAGIFEEPKAAGTEI